MRIPTLLVVSLLALSACSYFEIQPRATKASAPRVEPDAGGLFSARIKGHWRSNGDKTCAAGPLITLDGPRLVASHGKTRTVYDIVSDGALELHLSTVEPASAAGALFAMRPEFNATSEMRSFNLLIENEKTGAKQTWTPCEVG